MEARKTAASRSAQDAIAMLKADHQRVHALCAQFERAGDESDDMDRRQRLAERICQELEVHAQLEEELFYPAVRTATGDGHLMDEAQVEHQSAKELIRQIRSMSPGDALYGAKVKVLGEYVDHHVREEEGEMFPKAKKARVDLADLARRMAERRAALESEHSMAPFDTISSMLMMPIRAAASAARAGASAGRRAASGAARANATAGTGRGRKASGTGTRRGATAASSTTRAAPRASGAAARAAAGTGASASSGTKRGTKGGTKGGAAGRTAAATQGGRASASNGGRPAASGGAKRGAAGRTAAAAKGGRASKSGARAGASAGTGRNAAASGARRSRTTR